MHLCALKYRPQGALMKAGGKTVMIVVNDEPGLRFYVHRRLEEQVSAYDRSYMVNLIPDLVDRAKDTPEEVFRQLNQLSVGPLEAEEVEPAAVSERDIHRLYPELRPLVTNSEKVS